MVRHTRADHYEAVPRPVIAVGNRYPAGHLHPAHSHRRAQLLYGASGVMIVDTAQGSWVVPPQEAVWIPVGVQHSIRMLGEVMTRSAYVAPDAAAGLPGHCHVVGVSPLLRALLLEAVDLLPEYPPASRAEQIMLLLLSEIAAAPELRLGVPFPSDARLARRCRAFMAQPTPHETIDDWCAALAMSRRAFTRFFRAQTGLSLAAWQRRACVVAAVPRLAAGEQITTIAFDLGYGSPAAFTSMFKQVLGVAPSVYRAGGGAAIG
jgi:AraC-like DNA-binding protein/mannose-6-phosphate isomerase-like protein (cupin superfamily)